MPGKVSVACARATSRGGGEAQVAASDPLQPKPAVTPWAHLSQPVYALWTACGVTGARNGCVVTYANAVSIKPPLFCVALYSHTATRERFIENRGGLMQLLSEEHALAVPVLGKTSSKDQGVDKLAALTSAGLQLREWRGHTLLHGGSGAFFLKMKELLPVQGGDHDLAICEVEEVDSAEKMGGTPLTTGWLRDEGVL